MTRRLIETWLPIVAGRVTAYRELADLVDKGCLTPTGKGGRSSGYQLVREPASR